MRKFMLSRRHLVRAAIGVGGARLGVRAPFFAALGYRAATTCGYDALAALCAELRCPERIGEACLRGLPATEASPERLAALIFAGLPSAGEDLDSAIGLRHAIGDRSRLDFRDGRIATVDGWILSLTEARVYALTALLAAERRGPLTTAAS